MSVCFASHSLAGALPVKRWHGHAPPAHWEQKRHFLSFKLYIYFDIYTRSYDLTELMMVQLTGWEWCTSLCSLSDEHKGIGSQRSTPSMQDRKWNHTNVPGKPDPPDQPSAETPADTSRSNDGGPAAGLTFILKCQFWHFSYKRFLWNVTKSLYGLPGNQQVNRQDVKSYLIIKQSRVTDWIIMWYICQFTVSFKCRVYSVKKNTRSLFEAEMESMCFGAGCTKQPEREESATVRTEQIIQTTLTALQPTGTRERGEKSSPASAANVVYQLAGGEKKKKKKAGGTWQMPLGSIIPVGWKDPPHDGMPAKSRRRPEYLTTKLQRGMKYFVIYLSYKFIPFSLTEIRSLSGK